MKDDLPYLLEKCFLTGRLPHDIHCGRSIPQRLAADVHSTHYQTD